MVEPQISTVFRPHLLPDERVVWTGRPVRGLLLTENDWLLIPLSVLWAAVALYAMGGVFFSGATLISLLIGAAFGLATLFVVAGRFAVDAWIRSRTVYALSTRRALEIRAALIPKLLTAPLGGAVDLREGRGGRGTLTFQRPPDLGAFAAAFRRRGSWQFLLPGVADHVRVLAIEDPMEAYRLASATPAP